MPEMQETTSTSESIYADLERKEEKLIGKHDLNNSDTNKLHTDKVMTATHENSTKSTIINKTGNNFERVQQDQNNTSQPTTTSVAATTMNSTTTATTTVPNNDSNEQQQAPSLNRPTKRSANDFRFGKSIGEGSFSTVYLAKDIHTNKEYASE